MNALSVGKDKTPFLKFLPDRYLFIDDGSLIDKLNPRKPFTVLDPTEHSFNIAKDLDPELLVDVLNAAFPEGETTLTRAYSNEILLEALDAKPNRLSNLNYDLLDDTFEIKPEWKFDAKRKVRHILRSRILEHVLDRPTNLSFYVRNQHKRENPITLIARLNRSELGDFNAFILGNVLMALYPGPICVPDFGFYAVPSHIRLIRQERLIAGINSFDEVPDLQSQLLQIDNKTGSGTTPRDAETLALYASIAPDTNGYAEFIYKMIH